MLSGKNLYLVTIGEVGNTQQKVFSTFPQDNNKNTK